MRHIVIPGLIALLIGSTATAQDSERDEALAAMEACRGICIADIRLA